VRTLRIQEIESIATAGVHWHPLRRALGITAFRTNAYSADAGELLIEPHTEDDEEEMYVLITGRATFTVEGEEVDATPGTVVFLPEPSAHRTATATEDGTLALAVGDKVGSAGPPSAWEHRFIAQPAYQAGNYDEAYEITSAALADHPDDANLHYDLACFSALGGHRDRALEHWRKAVEIKPEARKWAADDSDLDSIRDHF
jgi:mannose-6-phosphate isomerase-like protein (cupin superfamily)